MQIKNQTRQRIGRKKPHESQPEQMMQNVPDWYPDVCAVPEINAVDQQVN